MRLLLDTHVLVWAALGNARLPKRAFETVADKANDVFISSISIWEICQKVASKKLKLTTSSEEFVHLSQTTFGAKLLSFDEAACHMLDRLPLVHKDPFDRMLICQAIQHNLTLVTSDSILKRYPVALLWD